MNKEERIRGKAVQAAGRFLSSLTMVVLVATASGGWLLVPQAAEAQEVRTFRLFSGMSFKLYSGKFVLYAPATPAEAEPEPESISFTMTAGNLADTYFGYISGSIGSIDQEPIPGNTFNGIISGDINQLAFTGDVLSLVSGLTVWVDDVEYAGVGWSDWAFLNGSTQASWSSGGPTFVETEEHFVEIK